MERQRLIREIHWIEWQLRGYEDKYSLLSRDFYRAMESGQLSEFDDGEDPHFHDFLEWHALYKVWLSRERSYRELLAQQPLPEQLRNALVPA
ncbi:MAG: hypothetical protein KJZ86_22725 [Caldilineaceae bacterium]|nr:hypothetical protein [Caldilineaceae bacterium]HRJ42296.1 hypothetical protein [Caldilineaceae bacterium]